MFTEKKDVAKGSNLSIGASDVVSVLRRGDEFVIRRNEVSEGECTSSIRDGVHVGRRDCTDHAIHHLVFLIALSGGSQNVSDELHETRFLAAL